MLTAIKTWFNKLYEELTMVNETPHRVALSFGVGVFLGILPFTGVLAAIAVALMFRLNKAAAILGSAITNTWLGLLVFGLAVKIGAHITGVEWETVSLQMKSLMKSFSLKLLQEIDIWSAFSAMLAGYFIISLILALFGYVIALIVISWHRRIKV